MLLLWNICVGNARIVTEMMKEDRSFDEIDGQLGERIHKDPEQEEKRVQGKRRGFAKALMKSVAGKSYSELDEKFKYWGEKIVKEKILEGR